MLIPERAVDTKEGKVVDREDDDVGDCDDERDGGVDGWIVRMGVSLGGRFARTRPRQPPPDMWDGRLIPTCKKLLMVTFQMIRTIELVSGRINTLIYLEGVPWRPIRNQIFSPGMGEWQRVENRQGFFCFQKYSRMNGNEFKGV